MALSLLHELRGWLPCAKEKCTGNLIPDEGAFEAYFDGIEIQCAKCGTALPSFWTAIIDWTTSWFVFGVPLMYAGARGMSFRETLASGETKEVDLRAHGLPEAAEILHLNFSPSGGAAMPLLHHGNSVGLGPIGPRFWMYGRPLPTTDDKSDGYVSINVVWHVPDPDDTKIRHLVDAAYQYQRERFDAVVVPANIAAEAAITPMLAVALHGIAGAKHIETFLEEGATYAHQINVVTALVAKCFQLPAMPNELRGALNRLRKLRNELAHEGTSLGQTRRDAAEHLTAAIFAVRYAALLTKRLAAKAPVPGTPPATT